MLGRKLILGGSDKFNRLLSVLADLAIPRGPESWTKDEENQERQGGTQSETSVYERAERLRHVGISNEKEAVAKALRGEFVLRAR